MTDIASIMETFGLPCGRCGKPGADSFEDQAALHRLLSQAGRVMTGNGPAIRFGSGSICELGAADFQQCGPLHAACADPGVPCLECEGRGDTGCPRCKGTGRFSVLRSVG